MPHVPPGRVLDGRYRLEGEIGAGALGVVYRATHEKLDKLVAVKVLHEHCGGSPLVRGRFEREAKALASLDHPNVVAVTDFGIDDDTPYLVMELLEGETLGDRLTRGALDQASAQALAEALLRALGFVHARGLVHRDVKPGNVFLQRSDHGERLKLLDFGLAKFTTNANEEADSTLTRDGAVVGTPAYMSPEQASGEGADARSDVYAAGVIVLQMLAGRLPFEGDAIDQLRSHLVAPVPKLAELCSSRSARPEFDAFCARAMAKVRHERFCDANEMLEALQAIPLPWFSGPGGARSPELGVATTWIATDPATLDAAGGRERSASGKLPTPPWAAEGRASATGASRAVPPADSDVVARRRRGSGWRALIALLLMAPGVVWLWKPEAVTGVVEITMRQVDSWLSQNVSHYPRFGRDAARAGAAQTKAARESAEPSAPAQADTAGAAAALSPGSAPAPELLPHAGSALAADTPPQPSPAQQPNAASGLTIDAPPEPRPAPLPAQQPNAGNGLAADAPPQPGPASAPAQQPNSNSGLVANAPPPSGAAVPAARPLDAFAVMDPWAQPPAAAPAPPALPESASEPRHTQPIESESDDIPALAHAPPKPRSPAKDPWRTTVPKELRALRSAIRAGGRGTDHSIAQLRRYNREHPSDPRGHLLLAGLYLNREWRADAIHQYTLAYQIDPSSRGAPEILSSLIAMIVRGVSVADAGRFLETAYRAEAIPAVDRALRARNLDARAKTRLTNLRTRLTARAR